MTIYIDKEEFLEHLFKSTFKNGTFAKEVCQILDECSIHHNNSEEIMEWMESRFSEEVFNARNLYDDMKQNELIIGTAEAEGFLRGWIRAKNVFKMIKGSYD